MDDRKIVYLDLVAKVKAEPMFSHLAELMEHNPKACSEEINDVINHISLMNDREATFYLVGYLAGAAAYAMMGTRKTVLAELRVRLKVFFNDGMFNYRRILR